MLARGVYFAPSQFEAGFVSAAHTQTHVEATLAAADATINALMQVAG
jgi:glutamate-1-semialdehyde 2,1-aminomutase